MGIKMGRHNRITAERFHIIKAALAEGMSENAVMTKYEIKTTTLRYIQKSVNYYEYRLYTEMLPAARKMPKVVAPSSGLEFEDISYKKRKTNKLSSTKPPSKAETTSMATCLIAAVIGLIAISLILIAKFI